MLIGMVGRLGAYHGHVQVHGRGQPECEERAPSENLSGHSFSLFFKLEKRTEPPFQMGLNLSFGVFAPCVFFLTHPHLPLPPLASVNVS
jgi:hypothetical protein